MDVHQAMALIQVLIVVYIILYGILVIRWSRQVTRAMYPEGERGSGARILPAILVHGLVLGMTSQSFLRHLGVEGHDAEDIIRRNAWKYAAVTYIPIVLSSVSLIIFLIVTG